MYRSQSRTHDYMLRCTHANPYTMPLLRTESASVVYKLWEAMPTTSQLYRFPHLGEAKDTAPRQVRFFRRQLNTDFRFWRTKACFTLPNANICNCMGNSGTIWRTEF